MDPAEATLGGLVETRRRGITVAALEALALGRHLEHGGEPRALELAREIAGVADTPQMAGGADLASSRRQEATPSRTTAS
jgi:hypothetical protein